MIDLSKLIIDRPAEIESQWFLLNEKAVNQLLGLHYSDGTFIS
jgi:hypothetical protein